MPPSRNVQGSTVTFVSTYDEAAQAAKLLTGSKVLLIDCEGHDLGDLDGAFTLLSIGTTRSRVFLIDVLALSDPSNPALTSLLALLTNKNILKVFWDGRTDAMEIGLKYGITIQSILDLQLVEVVSRMKRHSATRRLEELAKRFFKPIKDDLMAQPSAYVGIFQLRGLDMCISMLGLANKGQGKDPAVVSMHENDGTEVWLRRPLPDQLLQYAAHDIELIALIYRHFDEQPWIHQGRKFETLKVQSAQYVSIYSSRELRARHEALQLSRFMTLGLVDKDEPTRRDAPTYDCKRCETLLPARCFVVVASTGGPVAQEKRWSFCRLCRAITRRNKEADQGEWLPIQA